MLVCPEIGQDFDAGDYPVVKILGQAGYILQKTVQAETDKGGGFLRLNMNIRGIFLRSGVYDRIHQFGYRRIVQNRLRIAADVFFEKVV